MALKAVEGDFRFDLWEHLSLPDLGFFEQTAEAATGNWIERAVVGAGEDPKPILGKAEDPHL